MIYELIITGVCEMEAKSKRHVRNKLSLQTKIDLPDDLELFASDSGLDAVYQYAVQIEAELTVKKLSHRGYLQTTTNDYSTLCNRANVQ